MRLPERVKWRRWSIEITRSEGGAFRFERAQVPIGAQRPYSQAAAPVCRRHLRHDGGRQDHHPRVFSGRFHLARRQAPSPAPTLVRRRRPHRPQHPRARQRPPRPARSENARRAEAPRPGALPAARHRLERRPDRSRVENFPDRLLAHRDFLDHADAAKVSARAARKSDPPPDRSALRRSRADVATTAQRIPRAQSRLRRRRGIIPQPARSYGWSISST